MSHPNSQPQFFDISTVYRPADRTGSLLFCNTGCGARVDAGCGVRIDAVDDVRLVWCSKCYKTMMMEDLYGASVD